MHARLYNQKHLIEAGSAFDCVACDHCDRSQLNSTTISDTCPLYCAWTSRSRTLYMCIAIYASARIVNLHIYIYEGILLLFREFWKPVAHSNREQGL